MKIYIITGATSMIGIDLCQYISSFEENIVYAVCRKESEGINRLPKNNNINIVYFNLKYYDDILNIIDKADVFINLAWISTDHAGRNSSIQQELNVFYAMHAIRIAASLGCKLFVEAGSQAEYGYVDDLITEETPCNPEIAYGKAKLQVFNEGSILSNTLGLKYLHLRIFSTFGENDRPWTLIMTAIHRMLRNEELNLSSCTQKWNFLYARDCAKQIYMLCDSIFKNTEFKLGVFNIASKDTRPLREFVEEMKSIIKSSSALNFGNIVVDKPVSLNPSIIKTENAIGFINEVSFADAIKIIVKKIKI